MSLFFLYYKRNLFWKGKFVIMSQRPVSCNERNLITILFVETERLWSWLPWSSLGMLKASFNFPTHNKGSHLKDPSFQWFLFFYKHCNTSIISCKFRSPGLVHICSSFSGGQADWNIINFCHIPSWRREYSFENYDIHIRLSCGQDKWWLLWGQSTKEIRWMSHLSYLHSGISI